MSRVPGEPESHLPGEILDIIFSDENLSQGDLTRLARVSHEWHDAATPLVWHTIHGLDCFMKLIPDFVWLERREVQDSAPVAEEEIIPLKLPEEDFNRIYQKMRFVKVFIVDMDYADANSDCYEAIAVTLARRLPPCCLFPNLRSLRFDLCRHAPLSRLRLIFDVLFTLLLSPNMTSESLEEISMTKSTLASLEDDHRYTPQILTAIQKRYVQIEKVDLCIHELPPGDLLAIFGRIDTLRTLELHFGQKVRECDLSLVTSTSVPKGFASLTTLGLHGLCAPSVTGALRSWHFPNLQSFSVLPLFRADADQLHGIFLALHDHASHDTLHQLLIRPLIGRYSPLQMHHIEILAAFRHLTHVALNATLGVLLTDHEHEQVASWWPDIELLEFNTATIYDLSLYQEDTPAKLEALVHYARLCPRLRELCIPLTLPPSALKSPPSAPEYRPSSHPLSRLYVGDSPLDENCVEQTTEFLRQLFPNLAHIDFDEDEWSVTWLDVRRALAEESPEYIVEVAKA
ncbi:hypothetical protein GGG16DRAFT_42596 [Schizophyllum commune]